MPRMVYADARGRIYDHPGLHMAGRSGRTNMFVDVREVIPLPPGAVLTMLPGRLPVGSDAAGKLHTFAGSGVCAVGALLPMGYTRTLLPAFVREEGAPLLPLFGYTAVGWHDGEFCVAAIPTDENTKWDPRNYHGVSLRKKIKRRLEGSPANRILRQLAKCAREYRCCTAENIFYGRWEAGIPVSPACNAGCLGCISRQPAECCPSPQERIDFVPTVEEIVEVGLPHLQEAPEAIISFGQGCEGEPSLQWRVIAAAVERMRQATDRGTININTNGGNTAGLEAICRAGLDTMRVSLISAREETYNAYYRPRGYTLADVEATLGMAKRYGVYTSLNLLVFPGLTDLPEETAALTGFLRRTRVDLVQLRNLNLDPDLLADELELKDGQATGIKAFIRRLREACPGLQIGSFSRPIRR